MNFLNLEQAIEYNLKLHFEKQYLISENALKYAFENSLIFLLSKNVLFAT